MGKDNLHGWECQYTFIMFFSMTGLAMLDGCMYAVGGWDGSCRLDSVEQYNVVTNTWSFVSCMKMALTSPAVAALDGQLYVTGTLRSCV